MRSAIISDIHGNLEALTACMDYIDSLGDISFLAVLGDYVGYGANPDECISFLKDKADVSIIGNHDSAAIGTTDIEYFNFVARDAILWTRDQLSEENTDFLKSLPYVEKKNGVMYTHSTPSAPEAWNYIFNEFDAKEELGQFEESICFIGHSHTPGIYNMDESISHLNGVVNLDKDDKYLINIGSVGQPRDGDPRAAMCIMDNEKFSVEIVRVHYNVAAAREKIIDSGLPYYLGDRLLFGK